MKNELLSMYGGVNEEPDEKIYIFAGWASRCCLAFIVIANYSVYNGKIARFPSF